MLEAEGEVTCSTLKRRQERHRESLVGKSRMVPHVLRGLSKMQRPWIEPD